MNKLVAEFGLNEFDKIKHLLSVTQVDNNGVIEYDYKIEESNTSIQIIKNAIITHFPEAIQDLEVMHDTISFHPPDGFSHPNPTICFGFDGYIDDRLKNEFNVPDIKVRNTYKIRYDLVTKKRSLKLYELDYSKFIIPNIPESLIPVKFIGVGRQFTGDIREEYHDFYFVSPNENQVKEFLGDKFPIFSDIIDADFIGISLCSYNGKILIAKRHVYESDRGFWNFQAFA